MPAYSQDGIILSQILRDSTDASVFEDFIEELLQHCRKWPEPRSVLVMDNAPCSPAKFSPTPFATELEKVAQRLGTLAEPDNAQSDVEMQS